MRRTFREFYSEIGPHRRAQIVLGVVRDRHRQLGLSGDESKITFDAAEYLTDEATITAYLELVEALHSTSLSRKAAADAERARRRIADELVPPEQRMSTKPEKVHWSGAVLLGRKYEFPRFGTSGRPQASMQEKAAATQPESKALQIDGEEQKKIPSK